MDLIRIIHLWVKLVALPVSHAPMDSNHLPDLLHVVVLQENMFLPVATQLLAVSPVPLINIVLQSIVQVVKAAPQDTHPHLDQLVLLNALLVRQEATSTALVTVYSVSLGLTDHYLRKQSVHPALLIRTILFMDRLRVFLAL